MSAARDTTMKKSILFYISFYAILLISLQAEAFRLAPMTVNFVTDGEGSTQLFRVENAANDRIAVKIQAFIRQIDEEGKEQLIPTTDFRIFPEQLSLAASDSRAIRIIYIGKKELDHELAYRIVASQLPVSFKENTPKAGFNFLFQFVASAYVTNNKFFPKIEMESFTHADQDTFKLKIINKGQKHILLKNVIVELTDLSGKSLKINSDSVSTWASENILPGSRRILTVKSQSQFDVTKSKTRIEIRDVP